ncbi:alpha/beta hydrolase fold domain-containing protein [Streptomyces sp. NPDC014983]|uniref:alpha/beta hydrolase fold domain-containing protein n=1 Tax=Streptomyces sp. NPDC014983 TaxID=3364933 RepID=UPI00370177CF
MDLAGADPRGPLLSPAVCAGLTGLPPTLLQVGTGEILLDDSTRLAERARAAGVEVILDVTADVPHVFQSFAGTLDDETDEVLDRAALLLDQRLRASRAQTRRAPGALARQIRLTPWSASRGPPVRCPRPGGSPPRSPR